MTIAGYSRLSVSQDTSVSIDAQRAIIDRWAAAHGHEVEHYTDDGFSGSKDIERPAYERMVKAIQAGRHDVVVVKSLDRLGRRLRAFIDLADQCRIVTVEGGIDTGTPTGRMMLSLLSIFAEFEASQIGQRQATSQAYRRQQGRALGVPPFGFRHEHRQDGAWRVIDQDEAQVLQDVYVSMRDGASLRSVAASLNERGSRTRQGRKWTSSGLSQVLRNPSLNGQRVVGDDVQRGASGLPVIDKHLQVFSNQQWRTLQRILAERSEHRPRGEAHGRLLLAGVVHCGSCGGRLSRSSTTVRGVRHPTYRCAAGQHYRCDRPVTITARKLEGYVEGLLKPVLGMPLVEQIEVEDIEASEERAMLDNEISAVAAHLATAPASEIAGLAARLTGLREKADALPTVTRTEAVETGATLGDLWEEDPVFVVEQAIERVTVHPADSTTTPVWSRVAVVWRS